MPHFRNHRFQRSPQPGVRQPDQILSPAGILAPHLGRDKGASFPPGHAERNSPREGQGLPKVIPSTRRTELGGTGWPGIQTLDTHTPHCRPGPQSLLSDTAGRSKNETRLTRLTTPGSKSPLREALGVRRRRSHDTVSPAPASPQGEGTQAFSGPPSTALTSTSRAKRERKLLNTCGHEEILTVVGGDPEPEAGPLTHKGRTPPNLTGLPPKKLTCWRPAGRASSKVGTRPRTQVSDILAGGPLSFRVEGRRGEGGAVTSPTTLHL